MVILSARRALVGAMAIAVAMLTLTGCGTVSSSELRGHVGDLPGVTRATTRCESDLISFACDATVTMRASTTARQASAVVDALAEYLEKERLDSVVLILDSESRPALWYGDDVRRMDQLIDALTSIDEIPGVVTLNIDATRWSNEADLLLEPAPLETQAARVDRALELSQVDDLAATWGPYELFTGRAERAQPDAELVLARRVERKFGLAGAAISAGTLGLELPAGAVLADVKRYASAQPGAEGLKIQINRAAPVSLTRADAAALPHMQRVVEAVRNVDGFTGASAAGDELTIRARESFDALAMESVVDQRDEATSATAAPTDYAALRMRYLIGSHLELSRPPGHRVPWWVAEPLDDTSAWAHVRIEERADQTQSLTLVAKPGTSVRAAAKAVAGTGLCEDADVSLTWAQDGIERTVHFTTTATKQIHVTSTTASSRRLVELQEGWADGKKRC